MTEAAALNTNTTTRPGRPPHPETVRIMDRIVENLPADGTWIANAVMAKELGISSLACSNLAHRLEREGRLFTRLDGFRLYLRK